MAEQEEIDAALDAALDELDDEDDEEDGDDDDDELEADEGLREKSVDKNVALEEEDSTPETTEEIKDCSVVDSNPSKNDQPAAAAAAASAAKTASENKPKPAVFGPPRPPQVPAVLPLPFQPPPNDLSSAMATDNEEERFFAEMMAQVQSQFSNSGDCSPNAKNEPPEAFLERLMQEMQSQMQSEMPEQQQLPAAAAAATAGVASSSSPRRNTESKSTNTRNKNGDKKKKSQNSSSNEVDQAISNLIQDMAKRSNQDDHDNDDAIDHDDVDGEDDKEVAMLQQLIKGLGELGGNGSSCDTGSGDDFLNNSDALIDGMMEQLMSKDLMYEPMKQVADKFPQWLQERKTVLSPDEYAKREKQFECFQQLVHVYETEPNNNKKLVSLMQQVQEYGQPPSEIIQEIAPGLDLDPDGVPKFQFPGGFGAGGSPLPPGMNEEDCVVM